MNVFPNYKTYPAPLTLCTWLKTAQGTATRPQIKVFCQQTPETALSQSNTQWKEWGPGPRSLSF